MTDTLAESELTLQLRDAQEAIEALRSQKRALLEANRELQLAIEVICRDAALVTIFCARLCEDEAAADDIPTFFPDEEDR